VLHSTAITTLIRQLLRTANGQFLRVFVALLNAAKVFHLWKPSNSAMTIDHDSHFLKTLFLWFYTSSFTACRLSNLLTRNWCRCTSSSLLVFIFWHLHPTGSDSWIWIHYFTRLYGSSDSSLLLVKRCLKIATPEVTNSAATCSFSWKPLHNRCIFSCQSDISLGIQLIESYSPCF
jgi:hypothetical protein